MKLINVLVISIVLYLPKLDYAQENYVKNFNNNLKINSKYNFDKIKAFSQSTNAYNFMALGYFINANNMMYQKTSNTEYLDNNLDVIKPILIDKGNQNYKSNIWKMNVSKGNANYASNGRENVISEGYFFRYVGEFLDIITSNDLYRDEQVGILDGLKYSFFKWRRISFERYGDYNSLLFHLRLHTGANWATTALYLKKYDRNNGVAYDRFIDKFDEQLKKAMKVEVSNGKKYLIWNSTYPDKFSHLLRSMKNYPSKIQDVSHGNHVVVYFLKTQELDSKNWTDFNIDYLINTLELKIIKDDSFADNIDGSSSQSVRNTGWKQSDGWMKLIQYRPSLKKHYSSYYNILKNKQLIDNSMLGLQFFANLE